MNKCEAKIQKCIQEILETIGPGGEFDCKERKTRYGSSSIKKPVDLHILRKGQKIIAIEVAGVNSTQLVGEATRLFFDHLPLKLLVLVQKKYVPRYAKELCELVLSALYHQPDISKTPARVVWGNDSHGLKQSLQDLLCRSGE